MSAYMYIMSNASHTIYVGSTVDLQNRVREHKEQLKRGSFTARYHFTRLVYFEVHHEIEAARARELEMKKVALIQATNPNWLDLSPRLGDLSD